MKKITLDITKEHCPMTFVKSKLELSKLQTGDQSEIILSKGEPLENIPKAESEQDHKIPNITIRENSIYKVLIEKC